MWSVLLRDESGQGLTEYVLIIALVAVGLVTVMGLFGQEIANTFKKVIDSLKGAGPTQYQ